MSFGQVYNSVVIRNSQVETQGNVSLTSIDLDIENSTVLINESSCFTSQQPELKKHVLPS